MKVIDNQKRIVLDGVCIEIIPKGATVPHPVMRRVWGMNAGSKLYDIMARPQPYERLIMQRGDDHDDHFYVIPNQPHYLIPEREVQADALAD